MALIATLIIGVVAGLNIPVSLLPDLDVPQLTIHVSAKNYSARQLENLVTAPLRSHLTQVPHLSDIESETRDQTSTIKLVFDFDTQMDYAFVEVNEKIDEAMSAMPREIERPRVLKASAADIPVFFLHLTLAGNQIGDANSIGGFERETEFLGLSQFAEQVIRRRLEQLPEVAMADISGTTHARMIVRPLSRKLEALGLTVDQIGQSIKDAHVELQSIFIKDGHYQYNVRLNSSIDSKSSLEGVYLRAGNRVLQIKDVAEVTEISEPAMGLVTFNGNRSVALAIIQQSEARVEDLKKNLSELVEQFRKDYTQIEFSVSQDQTALLTYSIDNLNDSLVSGGIIAFLILFVFLEDRRAPWLVALSIPASLLISVTLFYSLHISINIISLSGLVLGLGMMVDNSIIVIDNITRHISNQESIASACIKGTQEVLSPMLSSMLTSCAVFLPLILLDGMAGTLFYQQAVAIVVGHFASFVVSIVTIPVYFNRIGKMGRRSRVSGLIRSQSSYESWYKKSFVWVMRSQRIVWGLVILILAAGLWVFYKLPKSRLPALSQAEMLLEIDWNENLTIDQNCKNVSQVVARVKNHVTETITYIGKQDFLILDEFGKSPHEALLYIRSPSPQHLDQAKNIIQSYFSEYFKKAEFRFRNPQNIFNLIFENKQPELQVNLRPKGVNKDDGLYELSLIRDSIALFSGARPQNKIRFEEYLELICDRTKLAAYNIPYSKFTDVLKAKISENKIIMISNGQQIIPVVLGNDKNKVDEILLTTFVSNLKDEYYPLKMFLRESKGIEVKSIVSGQQGEYYPVVIEQIDSDASVVVQKIRSMMKDNVFYEADFSGEMFSNEQMVGNLAFIILICVALLYLILAAQFESYSLPLIILIEVPVDIASSFICLYITRSGLNLMSLIGIIVMLGIIVNDSILKLDTVIELRRQGFSVMWALAIGGKRRLKAILMTSITTIMAMVPLFFASGIGAELQRPLALSLIGGMFLGTLVSLYVIPLCYYYLDNASNVIKSKFRPRS